MDASLMAKARELALAAGVSAKDWDKSRGPWKMPFYEEARRLARGRS